MTEQATRILLIRHGHNPFLDAQRLAGWLPDVHLSERGQAQARGLGARLAATRIAAIYSSPLDRAIETAQAIAAVHGLSVSPVEELGESRCGAWTGALIDDLRQTDLWRQLQTYPSGFRFPDGESSPEIQARMVRTLDALRHQHPGQTVVAVSHSDPIKMALAFYIGLHLDLFHRLTINPASITELSFLAGGPKLLRCNDDAHCRDGNE